MTTQEFAKSMTFLNIAYGKEMDEKQISVWYNFFRNVPVEKFNLAILRIIERSKYFPAISDIREEIASVENPNLQLDAAEEWEKVLDAMRYHGAYGAKKAVAEMNPVTAAVVKRIGGFSELCRTEELEWKRKSFMSVFGETLQRHKDAAVYSSSQLTDKEKERISLLNSRMKLICECDDSK